MAEIQTERELDLTKDPLPTPQTSRHAVLFSLKSQRLRELLDGLSGSCCETISRVPASEL